MNVPLKTNQKWEYVMTVEEIKEQFDAVIAYSQGIDEPQTDKLFEKWLAKKQWFIEQFGGYIYEHPETFTFPLSQREKDFKIDHFIETVANVYCNGQLADFIDLNRGMFFENLVSYPGNYGHRGVKAGMKLSKSFKFFEDDKETLHRIQSEASRIIQENKIEGKLCFSVHPLDYLSVSCNTYNWRSCHALDGEYRAGNLSYMTDETTVICYVKGADDVNIPLFPPEVKWNSKKWRVLLYFSNPADFIFAGKPYPFESPEGMEAIRPILMKLIGQDSCCWSRWIDPVVNHATDRHGIPYCLNHAHIWMRGELKRLDSVVIDDSALHFNDVLRSSTYTPCYTGYMNTDWADPYHSRIHVGSEVACLHCGKEIITDSQTMRCDNCELKYGHEENDTYRFCDCCGTRGVYDEMVWVDDTAICENCYKRECFMCEDCGEVYFNDQKRYDKETQEYICCYCYDEKYEEEE